MSTVSSLNRQNRVYTTSVVTPAADGVSTVLYASIGNFPNSAVIKSAKVSLSAGTLTNPTVTILNNGAAYKAAPTALFTTTAVRVATTDALAAVTYNSGAGTLTANAVGVLTVDGIAPLINERILVKNQVSKFQNGIYTLTTVGTGGVAFILTRATDADLADTEMRYGLATTVSEGTLNAGKKFFMNLGGAINLASSLINFIEYTALADSFLEGSATGTAAGQTATATFTAPGLNWQDGLRSGCLNLAVSMAGIIPSGGKFTIDVEYVPLQEFSIASTDSTGIKADKTWQALRQPLAGNAINITNEIQQNLNPYGLGADNNCLSTIALNLSSDKLYIGSAKPFSKLLIHPHTSSYIAAGLAATLEYWNGSAWVAVPQVLDNTSDQQATASTLSYAGTLSFSPPKDWTAQKIAADPMTVYETAILAGEAYPPGMMVHPFRYYLRFSIGSLASPLRVVKILPLA